MKLYTVIFASSALMDIEKAVSYYEQQENNLGNRFAKEVEAVLTVIKNNPYCSSIRYSGVRCSKVNKFPFLVHYRVREKLKSVTVVAVYNTKMKPFW